MKAAKVDKVNTEQDLEALWRECTSNIDFKSEVLENAHNLSKAQLNSEINRRISGITSGNISGKKLENLKKEARLLAVMVLRK